jgi:hypothetical protein
MEKIYGATKRIQTKLIEDCDPCEPFDPFTASKG